jgi:hypothetical protein
VRAASVGSSDGVASRSVTPSAAASASSGVANDGTYSAERLPRRQVADAIAEPGERGRQLGVVAEQPQHLDQIVDRRDHVARVIERQQLGRGEKRLQVGEEVVRKRGVDRARELIPLGQQRLQWIRSPGGRRQPEPAHVANRIAAHVDAAVAVGHVLQVRHPLARERDERRAERSLVDRVARRVELGHARHAQPRQRERHDRLHEYKKQFCF